VPAAGQRRAGAHQPVRAVGHLGQVHQGALPGGQGPEDPGQPAVRPAELQPGRDRRRARLGVTGPRPGQVDLAGGAVADLLIVLATSPRVVPGLLSWPAWEALRSAAAVLAPAGHPLLPALDEAGIGYRVVERRPEALLAPGGTTPPSRPETESPGMDGDVVWLPEPGADPPVPPGARLLRGSADLPG